MRSSPRPDNSSPTTPNVEDAAEAASVSRTTAYRYFPNQRALLVAAHPETETTSLLPPDATDAPQHEPGLLRQGRAIVWIEEALAPLRARLPEADIRRLALAIRSATGIEARVWLTDVAGLSAEEATQLMRWSAKALYRSALCDT